MERGSRKISSTARREKIDRVGGRYKKIERYCVTGQSPQRAVVPMEEEEEEVVHIHTSISQHHHILREKYMS